AQSRPQGDQGLPDIERVRAAVRSLSNGAEVNYDEFVKTGVAIFAATAGSDEGLQLYDEFHRRWWGFREENADDTRKKWQSFRASPPVQVTAGTLFFKAQQAQGLQHDQQLDE